MSLISTAAQESKSFSKASNTFGGGLLGGLAGLAKVGKDVITGVNNPGGYLGPQKTSDTTTPSVPGMDTSNVITNYGNVGPQAPVNLAGMAKAISTKNTNQKVVDSIGKDWGNTDDSINTTSSLLDQLKGTQDKLGAARDTMLTSYDNQLNKKNAQIAGNKTLIEKNQSSTLKDQAEALRKNIFNSSLTLGAAANSSAAGASARALQNAMGKNRQVVLTQAGDQISQENQNAATAVDQHNLLRDAAYKWEEEQKATLIQQYNDNKAALDRLKSKAPDWKASDIAKESESHLQNLLSGLNEINTTAKNYRDYINGIITGKYAEATATDLAATGINTPAALDTPVFSDKLVMPTDGSQTDPNATDFYNPNNTGKKRVGTDVFGNPLTFDNAMAQ